MKRALISVSDKENLVEFVQGLIACGYEIISTGGTYKKLVSENIPVIAVDEITNFKEILDGRVKTLHPNIHGGILAIRENHEHMKAISENNIQPIDLVCVNLYPFKETINKLNCSLEEAIENIDIGGPSMLRAAAKNYQDVTVIIDKVDYNKVLAEIKNNGNTTLETRFSLAAKVFRFTASYDAMIADYLTKKTNNLFPEKLTITYDLYQELRYGENPHQKAGFYANNGGNYSLSNSKQLNGKELSYNNIQDANAALQILKEFKEPCVVALKHMNPCGVGIGDNIFNAYEKAYEGDKVSIFGGIVAANQTIDAKTANELVKIFLEIIIAPSYTFEALEILKTKKNLRVLEVVMNDSNSQSMQYVSVNNGLLVQDIDSLLLGEEITIPTKRKPTEEELAQLLFGYKVVKHVKSNAIALVKDNMTIGIGAGQMNRVGAAKIAIEQAQEKCNGAYLASDAFFPMKDTVEIAAKANIRAIIQPGGSIRDQESIDECDKHDIAMVFTNMRHFKH